MDELEYYGTMEWFLEKYPIDKELSHLSQNDLDDNFIYNGKYYFSEFIWDMDKLDHYSYYKIELAPININHNEWYNLKDYYFYLEKKFGVINFPTNIFLKFGKEFMEDVESIESGYDWLICNRMEAVVISNLDFSIIQYKSREFYNDNYNNKINYSKNITFHIPKEDDEGEDLLDNLLIIKKYTRKIQMKNHVIKSLEVELIEGMVFDSNELNMKVISDNEVRIQKGNLTQNLSMAEVKELITEQLVGKKLEELPKHIKRIIEETSIINNITFCIDKAKLNLFD
jgi:hypothetical protein